MKMVIDTDPGVDDAMAIMLALSDPRVELLGLTTVFGNVPVTTATRNAAYLLAVAGVGLPVAEGAARPLVQVPPPHPDFVHGPGGLGGVAVPGSEAPPDPRGAAAFLCDVTKAHPGEVTLVALGPLTNLAEALARDPAIAGRVARVVAMGGAFRTPGNVTEAAEANIWQDPHAAARVLEAPWPVEMVGLDVTERVHLCAGDLDTVAARHPRAGGLLAEAAEVYFAFHRRTAGLDGCHLHDPTAVIRATDPGLFETVEAPVAVTLEGEAAGRTREGEAGAGRPVSLCLHAEAAAVRARFLDTLTRGPLP